MNSVSKAAIAAAVLLGMPLAMSAPAAAQKKDEAPAIKVSAEFRKAFTAAQAAQKGADIAAFEAALSAAEAVAQNDDEKYYTLLMRYDLETKKRNEVARGAALDRIIAAGRVTGPDLGDLHFVRGQILAAQKKYAEALPHYEQARALASTQPDLPLQRAIALFETNNVQGGVASLDEAIKAQEAAGKKAPEAWYKFAVSKLYQSGNKAVAAEWLSRQLAAYPSNEAWRSSLLIYMEQARAKGVAMDADQELDMLRLMRASKALGGESDYLNYADIAQRRGLPWEAKAVIEEGRAAGKIQASNAAANELYRSATTREKAEGSLAPEATKAASAANGTPAKNVGDAYLGSRDFAKAAEMYRLALQKGGVDANLVNTRLGIALAMQGQKAEAKTAFQAVSGAPRGDIARFWIAWLDQPAA
ncbi:tetratricopeptide repeat protein [Sphingomonas sp. ST-64]|uniref:Tetratricopeptide repeat protein n=1 Tax=Sphingomonas plantiphila TaxID=3163295 RepID=A0ABW8YQA9_9SPHN